jgi:hypothetical protein
MRRAAWRPSPLAILDLCYCCHRQSKHDDGIHKHDGDRDQEVNHARIPCWVGVLMSNAKSLIWIPGLSERISLVVF